jgi:hypothetical protein
VSASELQDALSNLTTSLAATPELERVLKLHWRGGESSLDELADEVRAAADVLVTQLPAISSGASEASLSTLFAEGHGPLLLSWCSASSWRPDTLMAPMLRYASEQPELQDLVAGAASERVVSGPLLDALACAPLIGDGDALALPANAEARARLEILMWEAGAQALEMHDFGSWIWSSTTTFEALIGRPAYGALRGRVLAARCLEVSV